MQPRGRKRGTAPRDPGPPAGARALEPDGRQRRSARSREAIVQALLDLVGRGALRPTAEEVAVAAGVGIRTVFRHFHDMETLFAAMDARVRARVLPTLRREEPRGGRDQRLRALVARRIALFEQIAPYKRSGLVARARSPYLRGRHAALVRSLRADLLRWLPELRGADAPLVEALDTMLSFEAWDRLRSDQRLGRERARAAVERGARALLHTLG